MSNILLAKTFVAEAAVPGRRIVKMGTADDQVVVGALATDAPFGVSDPIGQALAGGRVDVIVRGIAEIEAGGTIPRGARVTTNAFGQGVAAAPSTGTNNGVIGIALRAASSGDYVPVLLAQHTMQG
jgi:hypothetical protein